MNIMVIGSGGREHAIIKKLRENPTVETIYALPGNGGISREAQCVPIPATDLGAIVEFAKTHQPDFTVVAPDDPLALGLVDRLQELGLACFGPTAAAARIESSKSFAKALMHSHNIPTADYAVFDSKEEARSYILAHPGPLVVKADGLALGKGVLVCDDQEQALAALEQIMGEKAFGSSGDRVVIEERLTGPEVSVLTFTDGKTIVPMLSSMDHKRALEGDQGLNTGGMGVIAPNPFYTPEIQAQCMEQIFLPTIRAMAELGCPFQGCLYFGLMLTDAGPKVIEYNCRFGDPGSPGRTVSAGNRPAHHYAGCGSRPAGPGGHPLSSRGFLLRDAGFCRLSPSISERSTHHRRVYRQPGPNRLPLRDQTGCGRKSADQWRTGVRRDRSG